MWKTGGGKTRPTRPEKQVARVVPKTKGKKKGRRKQTITKKNTSWKSTVGRETPPTLRKKRPTLRPHNRKGRGQKKAKYSSTTNRLTYKKKKGQGSPCRNTQGKGKSSERGNAAGKNDTRPGDKTRAKTPRPYEERKWGGGRSSPTTSRKKTEKQFPPPPRGTALKTGHQLAPNNRIVTPARSRSLEGIKKPSLFGGAAAKALSREWGIPPPWKVRVGEPLGLQGPGTEHGTSEALTPENPLYRNLPRSCSGRGPEGSSKGGSPPKPHFGSIKNDHQSQQRQTAKGPKDA